MEEKLKSIKQILEVQRFVEGTFFLVGSYSEIMWISAKIMYQRLPLLTFAFYETMTLKESQIESSTVNDRETKLQQSTHKIDSEKIPNQLFDLSKWDASDLSSITTSRENYFDSKKKIEEEYRAKQQNLRDHHDEFLSKAKQQLKEYFEREYKELELKIDYLYEQSHTTLKSKYEQLSQHTPVSQDYEYCEESFEMYDVDIDDPIYTTQPTIWEFDTTEDPDDL